MSTPVDIGYQGAIFYTEILSSTDPDMQAACILFNFFFSNVVAFGLIALTLKLLIRLLTRT